MTTKELGDLGERLACEYLVGKGFSILGKNYRVTFGEIDIIAKKPWRVIGNNPTIHFVEVKTLATSESFFPEDHVNWKKQRKLRQMAEIWLSQQKYAANHPYQIDVIGIVVNQQMRNAKLHYFPNAIEG